ncbi:MAG: arginyl-tRNA synthetase [Gaiellaceae bacterium]|nr:arginyl-tRNA synthetase [Gaiellaceae bacterium]
MSVSVERLAGALAGLAGAPVELERPSDSSHGDYATNVALRQAPARKVSPRALAQDLADRVVEWPDIERAEVAGPGFLNLFLAPGWFGEALAEILEQGHAFGGGSAETAEKIQVELVSANPTGPLTVGSARNGAYGDSVARLLEFAGHTLEREYYYNDAGSQIDRFRASVEARRRGEEPAEDGYQGAYVAEIAQHDGDPLELMLRKIEATLERFRIHIDSWARQSVFETRLDETIAKLDTYEADGAVWVRTSAYGDEKDRVLIRSEGRGPTYEAADAVYIRDKLERGFDRAIYVLGADHHFHIAFLKACAAALGYDPERIEVLLYQLVHVVEGGVAKKMSKRRGDVVLLDELIDTIGVDATRWYLVARGHDQTIELDVDMAQQHSKDNPVYYVQYAHARIAGILRNAGDAAVSAEAPAGLAQEEKDLVKRLADFPGVVAEATERRAPHALPTYLVRVADDFHRFYHHHKVLGSEAEPFRLALCQAAQTVIARGLDLVGVEAPDRM